MSKDYIPRYITVSSEVSKKNLDAQNIIGQLTYRQRYKEFRKFTRRGSLLRCIVGTYRTMWPPGRLLDVSKFLLWGYLKGRV